MRKAFAEVLRSWLPIITPIITAVLGAIFTVAVFYYRDIYLPATAPINLTTEVKLKQAGFDRASDDKGDGLAAIEVRVTARNPSSRTVFLMPNIWSIHGVTIKAVSESGNWLNPASDKINQRRRTGGKHHERSTPTLVHAGPVFTEDNIVHPNETVSTSFVTYVPRNTYDLLIVHIFLPSVTKAHPKDPFKAGATIQYVPNDDGTELGRRVYVYNSIGQEKELSRDKEGNYVDLPRDLGLSTFSSTTELSLWPSKDDEAEPVAASSPVH